MDNAVIKWGSLILTAVGLFVSTVIYIESRVEHLQRSIDAHAIILESHTLILEEIQTTQAQHFFQREDRFEELEVGQRNIKDTLTTSLDDLFFHIGVLAGRQAEMDHSTIPDAERER